MNLLHVVPSLFEIQPYKKIKKIENVVVKDKNQTGLKKFKPKIKYVNHNIYNLH